ncbi:MULTISPECIES: HAD-IB family hydrolase [unclassified Streptomyces]|uniref:HAD family hydrolase n=1 Tax=unclassified Streptomyces TaxID=2593676 RepID=UPI002ED529A1|nr:HAD-IB family hydrolase [Streptomyces sp. NBC_00891]WSY06233.1 HAD-IB family hydrolase [Streptomyces sp. NBC_00890]WSZ07858.1 HAD-IB family hydrolase [Streptomyces sp. NBC_00869]WSZ24643.1 HAD-IB family hydrolase [Streptomyces sp. NBC_00870]
MNDVMIPVTGPTRAAFFDVDETLINTKSMFDFLRFWMARHGDDGSGHAAVMAGVREAAASGVHRSEINRRYYRRFAGVAMEELRTAGREWYEEYRRGPAAVTVATWAAASRHREAGDLVVLVSGSFRGCLDPLAKDLGADLILCSEPVVGPDGLLTGEVVRPMIGSVKADAVRETVAGLGLNAQESSCYGDHASDLDMLLAVGRPVVVGGTDRVLMEHAQRLDWPVLSAAPGQLRTAGAWAAAELTGLADRGAETGSRLTAPVAARSR